MKHLHMRGILLCGAACAIAVAGMTTIRKTELQDFGFDDQGAGGHANPDGHVATIARDGTYGLGNSGGDSGSDGHSSTEVVASTDNVIADDQQIDRHSSGVAISDPSDRMLC